MHLRPLPPVLILSLLALSCRPRPVESARVSSADTMGMSHREPVTRPPGAEHGKVEFQAPPLIPAMRAQLAQMARPEAGQAPGAVASYRGAASHLIEAMQADLTRVGLADSGAFKLLSDSVLSDLGGATRKANPPEPEWLSVAPDRMRRLMALYESWMRQVPK